MKNPLNRCMPALVAAAMCGALSLPVAAQSAPDPAKAAASAASWTDGEVRRIDREAGKLTIRHGEIKHLDMPPMTMVFTASDKGLLDTLKVGDKIRFVAGNEGGKYVVNALQPVR